MCEKINFVCNPRIIIYDVADYDKSSYTQIGLDEFLISDMWTKQLSHEIFASDAFPVTILEILMYNYSQIYTARIRYWDGVGLYEVDVTYDRNDNKIESSREYLTL